MISKRKPENPADESSRNRQAKQPRIITLRKDSIISFKDRPQDDWQEARILGRSAKTTSKQFRNYFNVQPTDGSKAIGINLDTVVSWHKKDAEEVLMVMVPASKHKDLECIKAKETKLKKLIFARMILGKPVNRAMRKI